MPCIAKGRRRIHSCGDADRARIVARAPAVVGPHAIVINRSCAQAAHAPTGHVAHVEVLISADINAEGAAGRNIEPIARCSSHAVPVCVEAAGCHAAGRICRGRERYGRRADGR